MNAAALWVVGLMNLMTAAVVIALCLPLWWRKVRPNRWYGMRVSKAYRSEIDWYHINQAGARIFIGWSLVVAGLAALTLGMANHGPWPDWAVMLLSLAGLLYLVAAAQLAWQVRKR